MSPYIMIELQNLSNTQTLSAGDMAQGMVHTHARTHYTLHTHALRYSQIEKLV